MKLRTSAALARTVGLFGLLAIATPVAALAQGATPVPSPAGVALTASGLENPRGFTWAPDGTLYVALAGTGGTRASSGGSPQERALGPFMGGLTGSVARINGSCPAVFEDDLPSSRAANDSVRGAAAVASLAGELYVLNAGGGAAHGNPLTPNGV